MALKLSVICVLVCAFGHQVFSAPQAADEKAPPSNEQTQEHSILDQYVAISDIGAYKFHSKAMTWNDARKTCVQEKANLAVIRHPAEESYLKSFSEANQNSFWIGVHDLFKQGEWTTVLDEPLSNIGFESWQKGEPNNYMKRNERCLEYRYLNGRTGMNDVDCLNKWRKRPFFCRIDLKRR